MDPGATGSKWTPPTHFFVFAGGAKRHEATQQEAVSGPAGRASLPSQGAGNKSRPEESRRSSASLADGDSHSAWKGGGTCQQTFYRHMDEDKQLLKGAVCRI